jgi:hypothetical protein
MVARTSSMIELVLPIIIFVVAPLEVGPEFAFNFGGQMMRDLR